MVQKDSLNILLSNIQDLDCLVRDLLQQDKLSISTLSQAGSKSSVILEQIRTIETEEIRLMNNHLIEQQEELRHLSVLLDQYQQMADTCKKNILLKKQEIESAEASLVEPIIHKDLSKQSVSVPTPQDEPIKDKVKPSQIIDNPEPIIEKETVTVKQTPLEESIFSNHANQTASKDVLKEQTNSSNGTKSNVSLYDMLEKKNLSDFKKAFSLNDRFRFRRELFHGNESLMNQVISDLNQIYSLEEAKDYISKNLAWDMNDETVSDFMQLLEKRYI